MVLTTYRLKKYIISKDHFQARVKLILTITYTLGQFGRKPIVELWLNFKVIKKYTYLSTFIRYGALALANNMPMALFILG